MSETISLPDENPQIEPFEYITEDGEATFKFNLVPSTSENGKPYFEIDIVEQPEYGDRDAKTSITHFRGNSRGGKMVCIGDYPESTPTIEDAKKWAGMWAKFTWRYIKTGKEFPNE